MELTEYAFLGKHGNEETMYDMIILEQQWKLVTHQMWKQTKWMERNINESEENHINQLRVLSHIV